MTIRRSSGLSLVELLVALALSAFLLAALIYLFVGSKQAYTTSDALARVQESGRFGLEVMSRDLRHTGYSVSRETCGVGTRFFPETNPSSDVGDLNRFDMRIALNCFDSLDGSLDDSLPGCSGVGNWFDALARAPVAPVRGWRFLGNEDPATTGWHQMLPADVPATAGDVVRINRPVLVGRERAVRVSAQEGTTSRLDVRDPSAAGLDDQAEFAAQCATPPDQRSLVCADDIVLVVDRFCSRGAVFQVSSAQVGGSGNPDGTISLFHIAEAALPPQPRNRTNSLGADFVDGFVFRGPVVDDTPSVTYYIAGSSQGGAQSLYRREAGAAAAELVSGIEGMIIEYAEAASASYETADAVTDWTLISSARISLLAVGLEDNVIPVAQSEDIFYPYSSPVDFGDRRLRQAFRSTVFFRNPG